MRRQNFTYQRCSNQKKESKFMEMLKATLIEEESRAVGAVPENASCWVFCKTKY